MAGLKVDTSSDCNPATGEGDWKPSTEKQSWFKGHHAVIALIKQPSSREKERSKKLPAVGRLTKARRPLLAASLKNLLTFFAVAILILEYSIKFLFVKDFLFFPSAWIVLFPLALGKGVPSTLS